jgi:glyceraldehyde 3-phosphate dehydrogenase
MSNSKKSSRKTAARKIRVGIMGFGNIGRHLYHLAADSDDLEVVAVSDVAAPDVLHYLLKTDAAPGEYLLESRHLVNRKFRTRILNCATPDLVPWDAFDVDFVVDATSRFSAREHMQAHLDNGAQRVIIAALPDDSIDRLVIPGINIKSIQTSDRMICAGSATTDALALLLNSLDQALGIQYASMTSVHAYSSDQALQDYAGRDCRRSRSAAENIIPNSNKSAKWVSKIMPQLEGRLIGSALNVPVQKGSMLDCTVIFKASKVSVDDVNNAMAAAAAGQPELIAVTEDPIVSSDVIGYAQSLLFDMQATLKVGQHTVKTIGWYENLGHAARIVDVLRAYRQLDQQEIAS